MEVLMTQYNPRYDTKVQPFNISIIRGWVRDEDVKEIKQWLLEGEPHKRLIKEAIEYCVSVDWFDGLKILFDNNWINLDIKVGIIVSQIHFCEKDEIWIFIRDLVFSNEKLIKKFSFKLFWSAKENKKVQLFDESKVDFTHEEATEILSYRYMFPEENRSEERKIEDRVKRDYLLSKPVYLIPYMLVDLVSIKNMSYLIEILEKHKKNKIFRKKEELFVFACAVGVYYQSSWNNIRKGIKSKEYEERIKKEQNFMLFFLKEQGVILELELTPKFLEKNSWINYNLKKNYGDFTGDNRFKLEFGMLKLKFLNLDISKEKQDLPEKQMVKLAWYWIGGKDNEQREFEGEKYVMTSEDKIYAEKEFAKL